MSQNEKSDLWIQFGNTLIRANWSEFQTHEISIGTTLEEVFLKIGHGEELEKIRNEEKQAKNKKEINSA